MLIDVSMPVLAGAVYRHGTPPVEIATRCFRDEAEAEYETVMLSLPAHTATHVDLVITGRRIALDRMIGPGKLFDVTGVSEGQVQMRDIEREDRVLPGDFVFFRTGWSRFSGTKAYFEHPELSLEVVQWLVSRGANAVGIDALGLGVGQRHGQYDRLMAEADVLVIENLANLDAVLMHDFTVYCFPLSLQDVDAIPARVVVEIGDQPPGSRKT